MDIQKMMKQAQEAQTKMVALQEELANETIEASAGGGMVKATMTGAYELTSIKIDPSAVDTSDIELLEDMVVAAVNEAFRSAAELANSRMAEITGGMNIPGLM
ncbi:MAG: YbaB/EbfC family nucleoid-associated protein [Actinomycetia bacterium]|nr:YbaB/EbfC family nucleoid-associated protein [Actinomycetes bacterium]